MECPYHHKRWRGQLQCLMNGLRGKVLLDKHIKMFPKAVCICKGPPTGRFDDLPKLREWVEGSSGVVSLDSVRPVLARLLNSASNDPHLNLEAREALVTVVALVRAAVDDDYRALEPALKEGEQRETPLFKEKVDLALSSQHIGPFIGSGGKHLKALSEKYRVQIQLGDGSTKRTRRIYGTSVVASLQYDRDVDIEAVKAKLQKRADTVTKHREKHTENVRTYFARKYVRGESKRGTTNTAVGIYQNPKEAATGQFEKKQQHQKSRPTDSKPSKPSFSALLHGHCLLCMAPYKADETKEGACTYHGGYLVKSGIEKESRWSCCQKTTKEQNATHELHSSTGCSSGRHVWRPGKADKGKATSGSSSATDRKKDFYIQ